MSKWLYPSGFRLWGDEERAAIQRVIDNDWYTYGPETAAFEQEIATYHGRQYAVAVNSGSSANEVAVAALFYLSNRPLQRGDTAVVPSIAWATTWTPLITRGMSLIVADCDETWNARPEYHASTMRMVPRGVLARLIVSCPVLGNPTHMDGWRRIADDIGAFLSEDACESLGAVGHDNKKVGTYGDISTLSFYMSHQIAGIEGGAILTDDPEIYRLCRLLRNHGWTRDVESPMSFRDEYSFVLPGMNLRPLDMNSAVQYEQLKKLPRFIEARRSNLAYFTKLCEEASLPIQIPSISGIPSPFGLAFSVKDEQARERLVMAFRMARIDCRLPTGGSFIRHAIGAPWRNQPTPNADRVHDTGLFLGNAPYPIEDLIDKAVLIMQETLRSES